MARRKKQTDIEDAIKETALNGHNKPGMTDDEERALLLQHKKRYEASLAAKKAADADFKNTCKKAKAECGKDAVANIKDAIAFEAPGGQGAFNEEIARKHKVARWMGLPVGASPRFFDDFDGRPAVDIAYDNGKNAGMSGEIAKPPHDPSMPQYQRWMEGWHDGQEILLSALGKLPADPPKGEPNTTDTKDPPFAPPADDGLTIPPMLDRREKPDPATA